MATVRHLGFLKFQFLNVMAVKRPILHRRVRFVKIFKPLLRYPDFCDF